ncbi:unnamed protein product [Choristocarpus tenellus]
MRPATFVASIALTLATAGEVFAFVGSSVGKSLNGGTRYHKHVTRQAATVEGIDPREKEMPQNRDRPSVYTGTCFVVKDNIDTDQIIPAEYLTLVPSKPDEYEKLGSYALVGLPDVYETRYVADGEMKTKYPIVIAGDNFGCGSSREHAPIAMGAAGTRVVVAESYARIYFRNCIATGELYPYECKERLVDLFGTGDEVTVDLDKDTIVNHSTGKEYALNPLGDAGPVIKAGGLFPYAIQTGMINKASE